MEFTVRLGAKQVFSWLSLTASLFIIVGGFLIFSTSTDTTGMGMVFVGLIFMVVTHFYLLIIPVVGLCFDVYLFEERRVAGCTLAEYVMGLSTSFLLYMLMFSMFIKIESIR